MAASRPIDNVGGHCWSCTIFLMRHDGGSVLSNGPRPRPVRLRSRALQLGRQRQREPRLINMMLHHLKRKSRLLERPRRSCGDRDCSVTPDMCSSVPRPMVGVRCCMIMAGLDQGFHLLSTVRYLPSRGVPRYPLGSCETRALQAGDRPRLPAVEAQLCADIDAAELLSANSRFPSMNFAHFHEILVARLTPPTGAITPRRRGAGDR